MRISQILQRLKKKILTKLSIPYNILKWVQNLPQMNSLLKSGGERYKEVGFYFLEKQPLFQRERVNVFLPKTEQGKLLGSKGRKIKIANLC